MPQMCGLEAQPLGLVLKPHRQREVATSLAEMGKVTLQSPRAGDVPLMALQSDLTAVS